MFWRRGILLLLLKVTEGYPDNVHWKLAFNIHGSDGHNFGYGAEAWEDESDVGTDATAFSADYKNYDVTLETANFIAIVRHQNGVCEAAGVWEFVTIGNTLATYLDTDLTSRLKATHNHSIYSFISETMVEKDKDPIFSVDGGLVFNWWYGYSNGVRIGNSETYHKEGLPAEDAHHYVDDYHGLGNDFAGSFKVGHGSTGYWHDVSVRQNLCSGHGCTVQGSDHGSSLKSGTLYGQYAIYISDEAKTFPCKDFSLQISVYDPEIVTDFDRIDRGDTGFLNYDELVFDKADNDRDGLLSLLEYTEALGKNRLIETLSDAGVETDFNRIDKNEDGFLNFDEVAFDIADENKDGRISIEEYSRARADNSFSETD